jgi:hypothetical protein
LEPQSENWATESASASGNWHAKLRQPDEQGKLSLEIKGKAGATETAFSVFSVPFTACDAPQIDAPVITGWLDERHLVFSDSPPGAFYVFDTTTGTIALLFDGVEDTRQFWW